MPKEIPRQLVRTECLQPAPKIPSDAFEQLVKISVGPKRHTKTFQVYRGLLCFHSKYFKNRLAGGFKESESSNIDLEGVTIKVFQSYYYWINTGVLDVTFSHTGKDWKHVVNLYAFADYSCTLRLKNFLMDYIVRMNEITYIPKQTHRHIYKSTPDRDSLRRWFVDFAAIHLRIDDIKDLGAVFFESEFLYDYIIACNAVGRVPGVDFSTSERVNFSENMSLKFCETYHVHEALEGTTSVAMGEEGEN